MAVQKLLPKIARLASESIDTPSLAYVWSKGNANLLIVGEIDLPYATAQGIIASIISFVDELWSNSSTHLDTAEESLENILISLNQLLARLFSPYPFNPSAPRYHLVITFFRYPEICLSSIGGAAAFVVSPLRFTNIIKSSQLAEGETLPPIVKKPLFSQIVTGKIKAGEALFLTNPAILDYFSIEQLRKIIVENAPGQAVLMISNLIKQLDRQPPISIIMLKIQRADDLPESTTSVNSMLEKQSLTSNIISPSFFSSIQNSVKRLFKTTPRRSVNQSSSAPNEPAVNQPRSPSRLVGLFKNIKKIRLLWRREDLKASIASGLENLTQAYKNLSQSHRVILNIIVVLIFIFSFSIVSSGKNGLVINSNALFSQQISELNLKIGEIETTAIYQDESKLGGLISEARILLEALPQKNEIHKAEYSKLLHKINGLAETALRQVTLYNPQIMADLTELGVNDWVGLVKGNNILFYSASGTIAKLESGKVSNLTTLAPESRPIKKAYRVSSNITLFTSDSDAYTIFNDQASTGKIVSSSIPKFIDATYYDNNRLYLLTENPKSISRVTIDDNNISGLTNWLRPASNISGANSLTVDGNIYTLNDASIELFTKGVKRDFSYNINPALTAGSKILTENTDSPLYILEVSKKRIIVLNKEGVLQKQFLLPNTEIKDMLIDGGKIYVFDGSKLYLVE